jgi:hypothetical protein
MSIEQPIFESALKNVPLLSSDKGLLVPYGTGEIGSVSIMQDF